MMSSPQNLEEKLVVSIPENNIKTNNISSTTSTPDDLTKPENIIPTFEPSRWEMIQTECIFIFSWCKINLCRCCITNRNTSGPATNNTHYFNKIVCFNNELRRMYIYDKSLGIPTKYSRHDFVIDIDGSGNIIKRNSPTRTPYPEIIPGVEKIPNKNNKIMCELLFNGTHDVTELFTHIQYEDWTPVSDFVIIWYYLNICDGFRNPPIPEECFIRGSSPIMSIILDTAEMVDYFCDNILE